MSGKVGVWAFILGVILSLVIGVVTGFANTESSLGAIVAIMAILGLLAGILNITQKETTNFIIAAIGLTAGSIALASLGLILPETIGKIVTTTFSIFGVFVAAAVFIPALKAIYKISKD
ncbi:MAG: hypothetical protein PHG05_04160 [Candidatus Nanoarchaeia archaeon]|nr:hypothetical protein [Candidatus Nanoarchaeia archaeon]